MRPLSRWIRAKGDCSSRTARPRPALALSTPLSLPSTWTILALLLVGGCAGPSLYPREIHEDQGRLVRLEARYGSGQEGEAMRFSHPIVLSEQEWSHILEAAYVKRKGWLLPLMNVERGPTAAFQEDDLAYLAKNLAIAFSKARPDEWVVFLLSRPREPKVWEVTSGGFFVAEGHVHLVLANYRLPVSMAFVQDEIRNDPLRPSGKTFYELVPQEHQTLKTYVRWYPTKPVLAHPAELVIDYVALLSMTDKADAQTGSRTHADGLEQSQEPGQGRDVENRLRLLQRLHEQGLITDEEYRAKRAKLLEEL